MHDLRLRVHTCLPFQCTCLLCNYTREKWRWQMAPRFSWLNIWNDVVLTLDEQLVRWYWCMFEFECEIVTSHVWMHYSRSRLQITTMSIMSHDSASILMLIEHVERCLSAVEQTGSTLVLVHVWIRISHYSENDASWHACYRKYTRMLFKYNGTGNGTRLSLDVDIDWINGLASCWRLTNRKYVRIDACLNLNAPLLRLMHDGVSTRVCADVVINWLHGTVSLLLPLNRK